jgi:hypothetical protein
VTGAVTDQRPRYTVRAAPEYGPGVREARLACRHGTTIATVIQPARSQAVSERDVFLFVAAKHEAEEGCGCSSQVPLPGAPGRA